MDFDLPADDHPHRARFVVGWRTTLSTDPRELAEAGYVAPHWPAPWGLDADPIHQLIIDDELTKAGVRRPINPIGIGWAGPTIFFAGTPRAAGALPAADASRRGVLVPAVQRARRRLRPGQPRAPGPSATATSTSSTARRSGSSGAQHAQFGILIARTDPDQPKHKGISYFICPMDPPGIDDQPDRRHDRRRTRSTRSSSTTSASRRAPGRRRERRLAAGQGHARQRARLAVERRRRCGAAGRRADD